MNDLSFAKLLLETAALHIPDEWSPCKHNFRKTEPSRKDKDGVLIWECQICRKEVSST